MRTQTTTVRPVSRMGRKAMTVRQEQAILRRLGKLKGLRGRALRYEGGIWRTDRGARLWSGQVVEIPRPVKECDGQWSVPMWNPERWRWERTSYAPDAWPAGVRFRSRARCTGGERDHLHSEDLRRRRD